MTRPTHFVQLIEKNSQSVLYEIGIDQIEKAYEMAKQFEQMDLDIELRAPSLPLTLAKELGLTSDEEKSFNDAIDSELDGHNDTHEDSCCYTKPTNHQ